MDKLISYIEEFEEDLSWKRCSQIFLLMKLEIEIGIIDSLFSLQPTDSSVERNQLGSQWMLYDVLVVHFQHF